jgi:hypothetical protein
LLTFSAFLFAAAALVLFVEGCTGFKGFLAYTQKETVDNISKITNARFDSITTETQCACLAVIVSCGLQQLSENAD